MPPDARLGDAPHLQALHVPSPRLDLAPRHVLQQVRPLSRADRLRGAARALVPAALVHVGFAAALLLLLTQREIPRPREIEIPVEMVTAPPEAPKAPAAAARPKAPDALQQALAPPMTPPPSPPVAPDPHTPAPPHVQPVPPPPEPKPEVAPQQPSSSAEGDAAAPKLVAPPPEPARAATQDRDAKPANLAPERDRTDAATHEARPADVPQTLATSAPDAAFSVPLPLPPKPDPLPKPAPPVLKTVPSEADKLAAALPMDTSAMPMSFRSVLAGNGAQVSAAYKGLVFGRFNRNAAISERAQRQHLKGQVIVAFTIDDTGQLTQLAVVQSSGKADVDALGLEMIRSAAPFPPPPPEAQRSFTPALSFGP